MRKEKIALNVFFHKVKSFKTLKSLGNCFSLAAQVSKSGKYYVKRAVCVLWLN